MPPETTDEQARQMMQSLLAERFKFTAHWDKKDVPILALVVAPGGFKLKPTDPSKDVPAAPHSIGCPADDPRCHIAMAGGSAQISQLAASLAQFAGRPVFDQTGLSGYYNLMLMWAGDASADSSLPSLPATLKEKFGLELKPQVGPVNVLVVDHVERPSEN